MLLHNSQKSNITVRGGELMKFEINRKSEVSLLLQIEQSIEDKINSGFLIEGEKLPSIRKLADSLGVSFLTVVKAYDNLESKNIIEKIQGKGCFVAYKDELKERNDLVPVKWSEKVSNYITRAQFHRHFNNRKNYRYDFAISCMSDYIKPEKLVNDLLNDSHENKFKLLSQYPPLQGDTKLRDTISKLFNNDGISAKSDELLIVNGVQQGINLVARTLLGKGDVLCIEEMSFPAAIDVFKWEGATIRSIPMERDGINLNYLHNICDEKPPAAIYVIPNFNNPTGVLMSDEKKSRLLELAQTYNFLIIEDDTWSDLYFTKKKPKTIKSMDATGNVIYLKGFSKIIGAGYRIGVISATAHIINILTAAKSISDLGSPHLTQLAVDGILNSKIYNDELVNRRELVAQKREVVINAIRQYGNNEIRYTAAQGGLCIWVILPEYMDTDKLLLRAREKGINYLPGHIFYSVGNRKNELRLSYSHLDDDVIIDGIKLLIEIVKEY